MRNVWLLLALLSLLIVPSVLSRGPNDWEGDKPAGREDHGYKPDKKRTYDYHTERLQKTEEKHAQRRAEKVANKKKAESEM